jgi:hypothetical protein
MFIEVYTFLLNNYMHVYSRFSTGAYSCNTWAMRDSTEKRRFEEKDLVSHSETWRHNKGLIAKEN